jgi:hypothetical protein
MSFEMNNLIESVFDALSFNNEFSRPFSLCFQILRLPSTHVAVNWIVF